MPIALEFGCAKSGDWLELSAYGWMLSASMIGSWRPLARYAAPMSRMNVVGECVSRPVFGLSTPRGASAPP